MAREKVLYSLHCHIGMLFWLTVNKYNVEMMNKSIKCSSEMKALRWTRCNHEFVTRWNTDNFNVL
jgi:hypothetical protein